MAAQIILYFSSLFSLAVSITCPTFTCESLESNVCAIKTSDNHFKLNENGCENGYWCFGTSLLEKSQNADFSKNLQIPCSPGSLFNRFNLTEKYTRSCPVPNPKQKFKNGGLVISCSSDLDCGLVDGTYTTCSCTFNSDSTGYCSPSVYNEDYLGAEYWRDCGANHTITDRNTQIYWSVYAWAWWVSLGSLSCIDIFGEINTLGTFQDQITTGASYEYPNLSRGSMAMALVQGFLGLLALY